MVQTPAQRRANERFHNREEAKMGSLRPAKADKESRDKMEISRKFKKQGSPVSRNLVILLVFVLIGGLILELIRLFF